MKSSTKLKESLVSVRNRSVAPEISVIVPVYNEESLLSATTLDLHSGLREIGIPFEIIICENGSTDNTRDVANHLAEKMDHIRVLTAKEPNYGQAMRAGLVSSRAPYAFIFDADYYCIAFLKRAIGLMKNYDLVIASKLAPDTRDKRSIFRKIVTRGFRATIKILFNTRIKETHGMKAFNRQKIKAIIDQTYLGKDLFDTELVIRAERSGLRVKEVPVTVDEKRPARSSILKRVPRTILGLLILRCLLWKERCVKGVRSGGNQDR